MAGTVCCVRNSLLCDLGEGGRTAAGAGARKGGEGGSGGGCWGVELSGEGDFSGGRCGEAVQRSSGEGVVAGITGAGGGRSYDGLARGDDCSSQAGHGAVMRAVAAATGRQTGVVVSQGSGQGAEQEEEQEQNGSATPHMEFSVQEVP